MDWAILAFLIIILAVLITIRQDMTEYHNRILSELHQFRTRQANIAGGRGIARVPHVDARARTTVRDTKDLPLTGRMSQGVVRKKRAIDNGIDSDS